MGRRSRLHKQAVIEGRETPFRASPNKPKVLSKEEVYKLRKPIEKEQVK